MGIWEFINPGDAFDKGYKCGLKDGQTPNKKRNAPWTEEIKYLTAIWNREHFWKSFHEGYNKGFTDGLRMQNKVFTIDNEENKSKIETTNNTFSNNIKSNSMQRGIDGQIDLLQQMKQFLSSLIDQFEEVTKTQENFIRGLDSEGLDFKLLERFEDEFNENKSKIQNLISALDNEQIPYTEQVIKHLEDTPR